MSQVKKDLEELPRQPVPDLDKTLDRYLAGLRPIISSAQYEKTKQLVDQFRSIQGPKLQAELHDLAEHVDNWSTNFWLDEMYLKNPQPLPVFSNAHIQYPKCHFCSTSDQLRVSAKLIHLALDFKMKIDSHELIPGVIPNKSTLLCMNTYHNMFPAYRKPGECKDQIVLSKQQDGNHPWHIIVAYKNQFFALHVKSADSYEQPSEDARVDQLRLVMQMAKVSENKQPLMGLLTTEQRKCWAKLRTKMLESKVNYESLQAIENCLFILCLDHETPSILSSTRKYSTTLERNNFSNYLLHGNGIDEASANRWYDKCIQIIVTRSCFYGLLFEHSVTDGVTMIQFGDYLKDNISNEKQDKNYQNSWMSSDPLRLPTVLNWEIDDDITDAIQKASEKMTKLCNDTDFIYHTFTKFGKNFLISHNMSPDCFIQVVIQLAYYKVHRKLVSTYESTSLMRFRNGRMDNIRAATNEALEWVKAMCDAPLVKEETKMELFKACINKHTEIMRYTINGEGPDNHLIALREIGRSKNHPEIPLFQDKSFSEFLNFRITTSQAPMLKGNKAGYGPVVPDGYGVFYCIYAEHITFSISSIISSKDSNTDLFIHSLECSLLDTANICQKMAVMELETSTKKLSHY